MHRRISLPIFALFVVLVSVKSGGAAQRAIPDDNLAYPVLITLGNGSSGSGFFLNTSDAVYLVTAKHVLFNPAFHNTSTETSTRREAMCHLLQPVTAALNQHSLRAIP
jgi:hypothetical protein